MQQHEPFNKSRPGVAQTLSPRIQGSEVTCRRHLAISWSFEIVRCRGCSSMEVVLLSTTSYTHTFSCFFFLFLMCIPLLRSFPIMPHAHKANVSSERHTQPETPRKIKCRYVDIRRVCFKKPLFKHHHNSRVYFSEEYSCMVNKNAGRWVVVAHSRPIVKTFENIPITIHIKLHQNHHRMTPNFKPQVTCQQNFRRTCLGNMIMFRGVVIRNTCPFLTLPTSKLTNDSGTKKKGCQKVWTSQGRNWIETMRMCSCFLLTLSLDTSTHHLSIHRLPTLLSVNHPSIT